MQRKTALAIAGILPALGLITAAAIASRAHQTETTGSGAPAFSFGERTKTEGCVALGALPDRACTPGAIFAVSSNQVCRSGYARSVRDVPEDIKRQVYAEYGIPNRRGMQYEVDHLVSLELGGSNDIANLWPEAEEPRPGFQEKDRYENFLHDQVCFGALSLSEAQRRIAEDWLENWQAAGRP